jgi:hypothetical protein
LELLTLASDELPDHLDDRARFNLWRDLHSAHVANVEFGISATMPFKARLHAVRLGSLTYARVSGTFNRVARTAESIRSAPHDGYSLVINMGEAPIGGAYRDQDIEVASGGAFLDGAERQSFVGSDHRRFLHVGLPRALLDDAFPRARDRRGLAIRPDCEPLKLLRSYLQLIETAVPGSDPLLADHVSRTIVDLVGLATGAKGGRPSRPASAV